MTIKEYLNAIRNKDGSVSATGLNKLLDLEKGMNQALNAVRKYILDNPPKEVKGYTNWYIDYHNMQKTLTEAENASKSRKDNSTTGLTHYQITKEVPIKMLVNNQIVEAPKTYVVTYLNYKGLDKAFGAVPVQKGSSRNRNSTSSQTFGGSLTSAERQSLSMVFGIGARQGDSDSSGFNNNSNWHSNRSWNNNSHNNYNNGNYNNGGTPRNFSQAGANRTVNIQSASNPQSYQKSSKKSVISKPRVDHISSNQFNNIKKLILSESSTKKKSLQLIQYAKTAGGLQQSDSLNNLPKKKYTSVVSQLKSFAKSISTKTNKASAKK